MSRYLTIFVLLFMSILFVNPATADVVYTLDFSKVKDGNAVKWLESDGFELKQDADDMILKFEKGRLVLGTEDDINGLIAKEINIKGAKKVRIEWGILQYPKGADWENGILREAVGFIMTFGTEKISSGSFVVPNVPYFITLFLGEKEKEDKAYVGTYWKKGGRYFCSPCQNPPGQTVITEFDFHRAFTEQFKIKQVPPITALAIESDTRDTQGESKAFIKKIEFLSD